MTQSFDEWFKEEDPFCGNDENDDVIWAKKYMRLSHKAGAESQQTEVEEMEFKLAEMKSRLNDTHTEGQASMYVTKQTEIDDLQKKLQYQETAYRNVKLRFLNKEGDCSDLQKRIDEALNVLCMLQYSSAERIYKDVSKILKGETK